MVIVGAGGHAIEVINVLTHTVSHQDIFLFDDTDRVSPLSELYQVIKTWDALATFFQGDPDFVLAVGSPAVRRSLAQQCKQHGGVLQSVISHTAIIGDYNIFLHTGLNIMHQAVVTGDVWIGEGTLVNTAASLHHNVRVGSYCEISPGARLLGGCKIGDGCSIGAGALVLPGIRIEDGAVIGAGAVVTRNVEAGQTVVGVPAKPIGRL